MKQILLVAFLSSGFACFSQETVYAPKEYFRNIEIGDSLANIGMHLNAIDAYEKAFASFDNRGIPDDRFKAAREYATTENFDSVTVYLTKLCKQQYVNYLRLNKDRVFLDYRAKYSTIWSDIINCVTENKKVHAPDQNLEWTMQLDSIYHSDQSVRKKYMTIATKFGWDSEEVKSFLKTMRSVDSVNQVKIEDFIEKYGWAGSDKIGNQGNSTLFLVIQHSDSVTQEQYLPVMKKAVLDGNARAQDFAFMEDRLMLRKFGYQKYGSQVFYDQATKKMQLKPVKDEEDVDERREKIGLQPLAEYLKGLGIDYDPKSSSVKSGI